jgi:hypothetical protein
VDREEYHPFLDAVGPLLCGLGKLFSSWERSERGISTLPYRFIICTGILARTILGKNYTKGLNDDNSEFVLNQLADDTLSFFLENDEKSVNTCVKLLDKLSTMLH